MYADKTRARSCQVMEFYCYLLIETGSEHNEALAVWEVLWLWNVFVDFEWFLWLEVNGTEWCTKKVHMLIVNSHQLVKLCCKPTSKFIANYIKELIRSFSLNSRESFAWLTSSTMLAKSFFFNVCHGYKARKHEHSRRKFILNWYYCASFNWIYDGKFATAI